MGPVLGSMTSQNPNKGNDDLHYHHKRLRHTRQEYAQFLIDFYKLQEDPVQQPYTEIRKSVLKSTLYE